MRIPAPTTRSTAPSSTAAAGTGSRAGRPRTSRSRTASSPSTTFDADISGASNGPIQNLILQTPPEGDWTVETKLTAPLKDNWQLAGLLLHADDDHYVKYDVVADNAPGEPPARRVELRYEDGGDLTGPTGPGPICRRRPARRTPGGCG